MQPIRSRPRHHCRRALGALSLVLAGAAAGCTGTPILLDTNATSAEVGFGGNDPAIAMGVARDACARYERVPRLLSAQQNVAYFSCEHP